MKKYEVPSTKYKKRRTKRRFLFSYFVLGTSYLWSGCTWDQLNPFKPPIPPPPPVESFVLRDGALVTEAKPKDKSAEASLAGAREFFRNEDYDKARKLYHRLGNNDKNPPPVVQEALYYEAECLRLQGDLPKAADVYAELVKKFTMNPYRDQAIQHMFDISQYWLQDTWDEIRETEEKRQGKRWIVWPRFLSFDKRKPMVDREGRAIERLKDVYTYEGKGGEFADKALFLCGHVAWFNEDYTDADHEFTQLHTTYPESKYAPYAVELAIKSKLMCTGGEMYDGRKVAEARKLVDDALRMPDVSEQKKQSLMALLKGINAHQAEKDFQMAEFWRRTGHPGSAYFYYEIVRRRYPGTDAYIRATNRMMEIRAKMEKEQADKLGPPPDVDTRPSEMLPPPRRVQATPEFVPMPQTAPRTPEQAPMPQKVPNGPQAAPPGPLPAGIGGN
jgi:outer membrane protein assembly factor BamD (BamD/ComL family)